MAVKLRPIAACAPADVRGTHEREAKRLFRLARQALGVSQERLAQQLGVSPDAVESWESPRGSRVPAWALLAVEQRKAG